MKKGMTGFDAFGFMLIEEGRIVAIRHEGLGVRFDLETVKKNGFPRVNAEALQAEGYEIGYECAHCIGTGEVSELCGCRVDGCTRCGDSGYLPEAKCPKCDGGGMKWETSY